MAEEKEEGYRVSLAENMVGGSNGMGQPVFDETHARDEKSYVRTRRRPHRKLRLFEDDDDDDVGVIGLDVRGSGCEGKGNSLGPTGQINEEKISDQHGVDAEFVISSKQNEAEGAEFGITTKAVEDEVSPEFGILSKNIDADGRSAELGILCKESDVENGGIAEFEILSKKPIEADVDDNKIAEPRISGKKNEGDLDERLSLKDNEVNAGDRLSLEKNQDDASERHSLETNENVDERLSLEEKEDEAKKLSRKRISVSVGDGDDGSTELRLLRKKSEAAVDERDGIAEFRFSKKKNEVNVDGLNNGSAELGLLTNKNEAGGDDGGDGSVDFRILRKRKRVAHDDEADREDGNAKLLLERKRRTRVDYNDRSRVKEGSVVQMKLPGDYKIDKKSSALEGKKSLNRNLEGTLIIQVSKGDVNAHKTSGNSGDTHSGKKLEKKPRENRTDILSMGARKSDHRSSNGASIETLMQGILLRPNAGDNSGDGRIHKNISGIGVESSAMDDCETKNTHRLNKHKGGAVTTQLGSKSLDRDSLRRKKSDVQGKNNAAIVSPKNDSLSLLQKQNKISKSSPTLQKEIKIPMERKTTVAYLAEETKRTMSPLAKETETPELSLADKKERLKSPLAKETKTPRSFLAKETKSMQRIARSENRKRLRERLRDALVAAGWKIDLRPRKGKNYDDNVYISPSGTSFWSLPKAWNALKGSLGQNSGITEGIAGSSEESNETERPKQADRVRAANILVPKVCDEDLSLLQRKRRRKMEESERKDVKRMKKKKSSHDVVSVGISISVIKSKEEKNKRDGSTNKIRKDGKRVKIQNSSINMNDKLMYQTQVGKGLSLAQTSNLTPISGQNPSKRRLHGEPERKHSTSKAVKKNKNRRGGCGLLVRSSKKGDRRPGEQGVSSIVKRTVIAWLVDVGIVPENECVQYWNKKGTRVMLEGLVRKDGILCECCNKVISVSKFEDHAGATRHRPFENIYLSSGKSLTQCLREAWDTQDEPRKCGKSIIEIDEDDQNDDTCGLCGDGGDLICCDKCPSTFHQDCLELKSIPEGDWYCLNCTCEICGTVGHVGENSTSKITDVLCCEQCEHEYHKKCLQERGIEVFYSVLNNSSFCGKSCHKVCVGLNSLLGTSSPLGDGFSWTLLRRSDDEQHMSSSQGSSQDRMAECNAKLSVAHIVMDECFMPIVDKRTNIDMVSNVVFSCWSNFNRLNYQGFYTAVLEKDDEIISVASIRIHGARLAEMPLIGTRHHYRRQGMCRRLVNAIEKMLLSLRVEKLILPAVPDLLQTWTVAFGFNPLEDSHKNEIRHLNLMVFPGTDLLQKQICKREMPTYEPA
ncbi:hypothetical protein KI387_020231, partial [Taxus chinensis]